MNTKNQAVVDSIRNEIKAHQRDDAVICVGIDGPTAAGKTTLADHLREQLLAEGMSVWNYRLDWTLASRKKRVADLEILKQENVSFAYEAELHMRLEIVEEFLRKVSSYNQNLRESKEAITETIELHSLYSREHDGTLAGSDSLELKPGTVIILEGHYSLRSELDKLIDLNIVLLGDVGEFLQRKVDRVKGYRSPDEAIDYFWRIDVPSFACHLQRFGWNADIVIDNSDYNNPEIKNASYVRQWLKEARAANKQKFSPIPVAKLTKFLFDGSSLSSNSLNCSIEAAIELLIQWDRQVGLYLRTSVEQLDQDLEGLARKAVREANNDFRNFKIRFKLAHTDAFYNVYRRRMPITLGLAIESDEGKTLAACLAEVTHNQLAIQVSWRGGHKKLILERELGKISGREDYIFQDVTTPSPVENKETPTLRVKTPTNLTIPGFLHNIEYEPVFIGREGENISAVHASMELMEKGGVWIHRFAFFSEIRFFTFLLECNGVNCLQVGNYLIACHHSSPQLRKQFKPFMQEWQFPENRKDIFQIAQQQADSLVKQDSKDAWQFVQDHCPNFSLKDGHLFSKFMYGDQETIQQGLQELAKMLNAPIRILRKRATQFIQNYFPSLTLPVNKLWQDAPAEATTEIGLETYNALSPTIFAEVYLWLALRGQPGAVLGANVYDIGKNSFDARAYLEVAHNQGAPINLQSSLNAVGHEEEGFKGYLNPKNGVNDFVEACHRAARDLVLLGKIDRPFFAIGLDHVNAENDKPAGRAKRFLKQGLASGAITHAVLDGAARFITNSRDVKSMTRAYEAVAKYASQLVGDVRSLFLTDIEVCIGELGYVGNEALIPSDEELHLFVKTFQMELLRQNKAALLARPILFIGNLGTTHHGKDTGEPQVELAKTWRDRLKCENFVSPVLHGTTSSSAKTLEGAASGCHKINIAGDFLHTFVKSLPANIRETITSSGRDVKYELAAVRERIDAIPVSEQSQVVEALQAHCKQILDTIHAPELTTMDRNFFHYMNFFYPSEHIDLIIKEIGQRLEKFQGINATERLDARTGYEFSASMIEVSPEDIKGPLCKTLWQDGIRYFHIDVGDGEFISRVFSGLEKAKYLRESFPEARLHTHLMVKNPHKKQKDGKSVIDLYAEAGSNAIAIHPRAFSDKTEILPTLEYIRKLGCRPGILIETSDAIDAKVTEIIDRANLDWSIVMGVPVGYGGQIFQFSTLDKISTLADYVRRLNRNFLIEIDGGLNMDNIRLCKQAGAQVFAGWSIVKSSELSQLSENVHNVYSLISEASH